MLNNQRHVIVFLEACRRNIQEVQYLLQTARNLRQSMTARGPTYFSGVVQPDPNQRTEVVHLLINSPSPVLRVDRISPFFRELHLCKILGSS